MSRQLRKQRPWVWSRKERIRKWDSYIQEPGGTRERLEGGSHCLPVKRNEAQGEGQEVVVVVVVVGVCVAGAGTRRWVQLLGGGSHSSKS